MKNEGFTLVEMIAVIMIIGVISTIAIFAVNRSVQSSYEKELVTVRSTIKASVDNYMIDTNQTNLTTINLSVLNPNYLVKINYKKDKQCIMNSNAGYVRIVNVSNNLDYDSYNRKEYCIRLVCDGEAIIDDFNDENKVYCE